ncbi:uncharacterized protein LOC122399662 [Colletes gigas]|uniref:uncharacterized protein LOC122399662 n=1 Tax=Colletes gigas TaxID=935657 RepID=UPI001C9A5920|nr:uncharacterized protein LOC122399662 [Colletes gigas]
MNLARVRATGHRRYCSFAERFGVWQNVHVLDGNGMVSSVSVARLRVHIQSWYDEVEVFDSAEFGLVNFTARGNLSYIAFASATISQVGCGRAIYTARLDEPTNRGEFPTIVHTIPGGIEDRVETLVCNYGPLDRKTPRELYEDGVPALCPPGTNRSSRYRALCQLHSNACNRLQTHTSAITVACNPIQTQPNAIIATYNHAQHTQTSLSSLINTEQTANAIVVIYDQTQMYMNTIIAADNRI